MGIDVPLQASSDGIHKHMLFFQDLKLSISEWVPFGQNAISTFNDSIDSVKGIKSSLLTGTVDEEPDTSTFEIEPKFTRVYLKDFDKRHHAGIANLLACKECSGEVDIEARDDAPYLLCKDCNAEEKVAIFDIDEVAYVSRPNFTEIWLPLD